MTKKGSTFMEASPQICEKFKDLTIVDEVLKGEIMGFDIPNNVYPCCKFCEKKSPDDAQMCPRCGNSLEEKGFGYKFNLDVLPSGDEEIITVQGFKKSLESLAIEETEKEQIVSILNMTVAGKVVELGLSTRKEMDFNGFVTETKTIEVFEISETDGFKADASEEEEGE